MSLFSGFSFLYTGVYLWYPPPRFKCWGEILLFFSLFLFLSVSLGWLYMASVIFWYELWEPKSATHGAYVQVVPLLFFQKWPNKGKRRENKEGNKRERAKEGNGAGAGGGPIARRDLYDGALRISLGFRRLKFFFLLTLKDLIGNSRAVNLPSSLFLLLLCCIFASWDHPPPSSYPRVPLFPILHGNIEINFPSHTAPKLIEPILPEFLALIFFFFFFFRSFYDEEEDILIQMGHGMRTLRYSTWLATTTVGQSR